MACFIFLIFSCALYIGSYAATSEGSETIDDILVKSLRVLDRWDSLPEEWRKKFAEDHSGDMRFEIPLLQAMSRTLDDARPRTLGDLQKILNVSSPLRILPSVKEPDEAIMLFWVKFQKTPYGAAITKHLKEEKISFLESLTFLKHLFQASYNELAFSSTVSAFDIMANFFDESNQLKSSLASSAKRTMDHSYDEELTVASASCGSFSTPPRRRGSDVELQQGVATADVASSIRSPAPAEAGRALETGEAVGAQANEPPASDGTAARTASNTATVNATKPHVGADDPDRSEVLSSKRTPPDRKQLFSSFPYSWKQVAAGIGAIGIIVLFGKWAFSNVFPVDVDPSL